DLPGDLRSIGRDAAVDLGLVEPENLGTPLAPHLRTRYPAAARQDQRVWQSIRRDLLFGVVGDVTRRPREADRVPFRVALANVGDVVGVPSRAWRGRFRLARPWGRRLGMARGCGSEQERNGSGTGRSAHGISWCRRDWTRQQP